MSRRGRLLLLFSLVVSDALALVIAVGVAYWLIIQPALPTGPYGLALLAGVIPWVASFAALRLYDLETVLEDSQEYATVATACTYGILLIVVLAALFNFGNLSLRWVLAAWATGIVAAGAGRFVMRRVVRAMRRQGHLLARALVVGADEQGRTIARQLRSVTDSGLHVLGFVDDFLPRGTPVQDGLAVLGHPGVLPALVREQNVAEIIVVPGAMAWESFQQILAHMTLEGGPHIRLSPGYYDLLATTPRVAHRNFVPLFVVDSARLTGFDALLKALLDYGLGLVVFLVTLPIAAVVALTRLGRGRVLQPHQYLGIGGRPFRAFTFATQPGSALARTGLHQLPLLWAVLGGRMSLVGPRPLEHDERGHYERWLPSLASVRPGLSGPWAVVPVASIEEEMRAALYYIRNWTIWLDVQVLAQTVLVTLRQRWGTLN